MKNDKFLFTITYLECNGDGSFWSRETNTHTVKVIAETKDEAIEKMKKVTGVKYYKNLCWECEEIITDELKNE